MKRPDPKRRTASPDPRSSGESTGSKILPPLATESFPGRICYPPASKFVPADNLQAAPVKLPGIEIPQPVAVESGDRLSANFAKQPHFE